MQSQDPSKYEVMFWWKKKNKEKRKYIVVFIIFRVTFFFFFWRLCWSRILKKKGANERRRTAMYLLILLIKIWNFMLKSVVITICNNEIKLRWTVLFENRITMTIYTDVLGTPFLSVRCYHTLQFVESGLYFIFGDFL